MYRIFKARNSAIAIEEFTGATVLLFAAVILIFAFYIYNVFDQKQKSEQITIDLEDIDVNYNLNSFLKFPVEENKIVADLISDAYIANDYDKVKIISENFFSGIYVAKGLSHVIIIGTENLYYTDFREITAISKAKIPSAKGIPIDVEIYVGKSGQILTS